jgi:hypothetical protein
MSCSVVIKCHWLASAFSELPLLFLSDLVAYYFLDVARFIFGYLRRTPQLDWHGFGCDFSPYRFGHDSESDDTSACKLKSKRAPASQWHILE